MIKPRTIFDLIEPYLHSPEAIVITGMRRTGKTTLLNWAYEQINSQNKIFLDLENPLNRKYFEEENYERIKGTFELLGIDFGQRPFVFLDEIQFVKNIPSIVKYFIDHYGIKFFLTGSASFYLKNLFTEPLAGRKYVFEIYPLTFGEFLVFKDVKINVPQRSGLSKAIYETLSPLYEEYLLFGGFPGVVLKTSKDEKLRALDDIFSSFFQLEVLHLGDFKRNEAIRDLILLLAQRIGTKLDIKRLSKELGVSWSTLKEYISFLEGTYFIGLIRPFSRGRDTEIRKAPKVYLCDCGLANHLVKLEIGPIFENCVFQNLRVRGNLNYYQKKTGVEIDFILNKEVAYEAKVRPYDSDVRKLKRMAKELGLQEYTIVSKEYCDIENTIFGFQL
ncbi:MAG: ATP-binding protein [Deltaproteobacteria bacterium]|nr:ATP-binding protein [Deltaproteobacteria bacterium]MBW1930581.1 ATP-binding protein [Deltaproteobacteria bacterium]MBW2026035.1 ATP-binding protein [Deltaproteobacteria bacterium]